jgi:SAM-dependent methyltransferase
MTDRPTWHDDDEFWAALAPWLFDAERIEKAPEEVERLLELLGIEPPAAVLDLCCGPGRHSIELARRGFAVTAVDRTEAYLHQARRRAEEQDVTIELVREDMRKFLRPGAFDAAISLFTSFGYFRDIEDDRTVLRNLREGLKDGGRLVMEMMGKEVLAKRFRERDWQERDGVILLEERKLADGWSWIDNRWILIDRTDRREFTVSHRLYSGAELRRELLDAGFAGVELFGDLDGAAYDHKANRLVAVATR